MNQSAAKEAVHALRVNYKHYALMQLISLHLRFKRSPLICCSTLAFLILNPSFLSNLAKSGANSSFNICLSLKPHTRSEVKKIWSPHQTWSAIQVDQNNMIYCLDLLRCSRGRNYVDQFTSCQRNHYQPLPQTWKWEMTLLWTTLYCITHLPRFPSPFRRASELSFWPCVRPTFRQSNTPSNTLWWWVRVTNLKKMRSHPMKQCSNPHKRLKSYKW